MTKAFKKETDEAPEEPDQPETLPANSKNYMTPKGYAILQEELRYLLCDERPQIVETVSWAAKNGAGFHQ